MLLLAMFMADVVQAAPLGLAMQLLDGKGTHAVHCDGHEHDAGNPAPDAPKQHKADCHACFGCVSMLPFMQPFFAVHPVGEMLQPKPEASYFTYVGAPPQRPPISL